jgi:hypothetical protein
MEFIDPLNGFGTYDASDSAELIARRLEKSPFQYCVIREKKPNKESWHVFKVDGRLLRKLKVKKSRIKVETALGLSGLSGADCLVVKADITLKSLDRKWLSSRRPIVFVDPIGDPWALHAGFLDEGLTGARLNEGFAEIVPAPSPASPPSAPVPHDSGMPSCAASEAPQTPLPKSSATLFTQASCLDGDEVSPDQVVEISVKIGSVAPPGASVELNPVFPEGAETLALYAQVSSREFSMPDGESWLKSCVVDRKLKCSPGELLFKVRAIGDRPSYSLTISLSSAGTVLQSHRVTLGRKGAGKTPLFSSQSEGRLAMPGKSGAQMRVDIADQGSDLFNISLYDKGVLWGKTAAPCRIPDFFGWMDAKTAAEVGDGLWIQLPQLVRDFLSRPDARGKTILFVSNGSVAPFEMLRLPGGFLGIENPVTRWIPDQGMSATASLKVVHAACVRPVYKKADALASAEKEELYMQTRFGGRLSVARKGAEVERILNDGLVSLFHFAGHADGNPAHLVLEDSKIEPTGFSGSQALKMGKPLFFLNGCRGGLGCSDVPAMLGDFARSMLVNECTAFIAPMVKVDSEAASQAAEIFYEALSTETVGEAVRRVRAKALDGATPDKHKKSFLSYAAFSAPDLKLEL